MKEVSVKEFLGEVLLIAIKTLILSLCVMFLWNYNISVIFPRDASTYLSSSGWLVRSLQDFNYL